LIRDHDDFGVIVLGDPRLKTKNYGRVFLQALPPSPVITDAAQGVQFLSDRLRQAGVVPAAAGNGQVAGSGTP
jgi:ATP-dependent DNA helicase DinG